MWRTLKICAKFQIIFITICLFCIESTADKVDCSNEFVWQCDTGNQCIHSEDLCDGIKNCQDGSDETVKNCIGIPCPTYGFRCTYGACIGEGKNCTGQADCADGSDELPALCQPSLWRKELQGDCQSFQMKCRSSGECISDDKQCDGVADCKDASDESLEVCSTYNCPYLSFRCGYGGCVSGDSKCSGIAECYDASDESPVMCKNITKVAQVCRIPFDKNSLIIKNQKTNTIVRPGAIVEEGTILQFSCEAGYLLNGPTFDICNSGGLWSTSLPSCTIKPTKAIVLAPVNANVCQIPFNNNYLIVKHGITYEIMALGAFVPASTPLSFACQPGYVLKGINNAICRKNNEWNRNLPTCLSYCSDKHTGSGFSTEVTYELHGAVIKNKSSFEPGTIAKISCAYFYEPAKYFRDSLNCTGRNWYPLKLACYMNCGQPVDPVTKFSKGGINTNIDEVPWHVGVYRKEDDRYDNICGGTLISPRLVVSAAHCFHPKPINEDWSSYSIAAGKNNRDYYSEEHSLVEKRNIIDVLIPNDYRGAGNSYYRDISLIKLDRFITFSDTIRPVCLFKSTEEASQYVPLNKTGRISAWNQISARDRISTLQTLHMSTVDYHTCRAKLLEESHVDLKGDKFCLASPGNQAFACKGDSGSGFVVRGSDNTFVLWGIVSYSPTRTKECSRDNLLVMTNALIYTEWLKSKKRQDLNDDVILE